MGAARFEREEEGERVELGPIARIGSSPSNILNIVLLPDPEKQLFIIN